MSDRPFPPAGIILPEALGLNDLQQWAGADAAWLWHGYLARGSVTLLTSQWKSGKTTLVAVLLARLGTGGTLAGRAVTAGKAVVVSEESPQLWLQRSRRLEFGTHLAWLCRPFAGRPQATEWAALIDHLAGLHAQQDLALVVIDPLAHFLPGVENHADGMLAALAPLHRLARQGLAVLLTHHPRKAAARAGMRSRGSGALPGFADILLEMDWLDAANQADRRRVLRAYSRFPETPAGQVIELTESGTDYRSLGDLADADFDPSWLRLRQLLAAADGKLTQREMLARWPAQWPRPNEATLWRWLQAAVGRGLIYQEGSGRKNEPYRYGLRK